MSKQYYVENLSAETLTELTDEMLRFKKNKKNKKINFNLLKIIPAVAAIALVIGLINILSIYINYAGAEVDNSKIVTSGDSQTTIYYREFEKYEDRFNDDSPFEWKTMEILEGSKNMQDDTLKSYYVDQVIQDVIADLITKYNYSAQMAFDVVSSGGLNIYSCMDKYIQCAMESIYMNNDFFPEQPEGAIKQQSAMVILDPHNGDLLGIVGGRGDKVQGGGMNRASMVRKQPGSAINPISVYAPALDTGIINYDTLLDDSPIMEINGKGWPANLPAGYQGQITLADAIKASKNTTAVRVLQMLTPEKSFRFMYDKLNMKSLVDEMVLPDGRIYTDIDLAPLALGGLTYGVSIYELTGAYTMLANQGVYSKPRSYTKVTDNNGNVILDNSPEQTAVIKKETADIMTKLLTGVVENGTAKSFPMKDKIQVAGATGISDNDYDRWFIGYTPYFLCGVWYGYDMPQSLGIDMGAGNPPLKLFNYVMNTIHDPVY